MTKNTKIEMGLLNWLGLLFITLHLSGYINWHLIWVLSPLWAEVLITGFIVLVRYISEDDTEIAGGGMNFLRWLGIVFVGLYLTGHINWNFFWVLSPLLVDMFISWGTVVTNLKIELASRK